MEDESELHSKALPTLQNVHDESSTVTATAPARAGLLGNPGDGYGGKAIAVAVADFGARVTLEPADRFELVAGPSDHLQLASAAVAVQEFLAVGCEDGLRLLRASLLRFWRHWPALTELPAADPRLRFRMRYSTDIPRQVGLSGSSAIVTAALRALATWFGVEVSPDRLAELALAAEVQELRLAGGPMDRVIQAYGGLVLMDLREPRGPDAYRRLDPALLPPLFIAWNPRGGESSGRPHGVLTERYRRRDPEVMGPLQELRDLVDEGAAALERRDHTTFRALVDRNFDLRARIFPIADTDRQMIDIARTEGAAAKFCGSGGAIVGSPANDTDFGRIAAAFSDAGFRFLQPQVAAPPVQDNTPRKARRS